MGLCHFDTTLFRRNIMLTKHHQFWFNCHFCKASFEHHFNLASIRRVVICRIVVSNSVEWKWKWFFENLNAGTSVGHDGTALPPCPAAMPCRHAAATQHSFLLVAPKREKKWRLLGGSMLQTSFHPNWPFEKLKLNREVRQMKARVCPSGKL